MQQEKNDDSSIKLQWFLMISIILGTIIIIGINIPYTTTEQYNTTENYTEKQPYTGTNNYTEQETYTVPIYHGYLFHDDILQSESITYILENVTQYFFNYTGKNNKQQDEYNYTICYQLYCHQYTNITDTAIRVDNVTKYRNVQKTREVEKYRYIIKFRKVNKTIYTNISLLQRFLQNKTS